MRTGFVAEFLSADQAVEAAARLTALGYVRLEAYTPYPIPELEAHMGIRRTVIPRFVFAAGLTGVVLAFLVIYLTNAVDYPLNVGGRPLNSLPTYVPILFETTILFASVTAFLCALLFSGLPRLYHPVFEIDGVERTSMDRFWIGIDVTDPKLDPKVLDELSELGAVRVRAVGFRQ